MAKTFLLLPLQTPLSKQVVLIVSMFFDPLGSLALALTEVEDVRGPLAKFRGKNIPLEFAKWEEELKEQMRLQWEEEQKSKKGKGFGAFRLSGQQQEQPPVPFFEVQRQQFQEHFRRTHKAVEEEAAQNLKKQKELESKLKSMKISVWDIMTKVTERERGCSVLAQ